VLRILSAEFPCLRRAGVERQAHHGPFARDAARPGSDVDLATFAALARRRQNPRRKLIAHNIEGSLTDVLPAS
jgi:predicted nucleotidyltransferase